MTSRGELVIIPVYHPAAVTHNPRLKGALFEDFRIIGTMLGKRQRGGRYIPGPDEQSIKE